jgi:hypothetical protein
MYSTSYCSCRQLESNEVAEGWRTIVTPLRVISLRESCRTDPSLHSTVTLITPESVPERVYKVTCAKKNCEGGRVKKKKVEKNQYTNKLTIDEKSTQEWDFKTKHNKGKK